MKSYQKQTDKIEIVFSEDENINKSKKNNKENNINDKELNSNIEDKTKPENSNNEKKEYTKFINAFSIISIENISFPNNKKLFCNNIKY